MKYFSITKFPGLSVWKNILGRNLSGCHNSYLCNQIGLIYVQKKGGDMFTFHIQLNRKKLRFFIFCAKIGPSFNATLTKYKFWQTTQSFTAL